MTGSIRQSLLVNKYLHSVIMANLAELCECWEIRTFYKETHCYLNAQAWAELCRTPNTSHDRRTIKTEINSSLHDQAWNLIVFKQLKPRCLPRKTEMKPPGQTCGLFLSSKTSSWNLGFCTALQRERNRHVLYLTHTNSSHTSLSFFLRLPFCLSQALI